MNYYTRLLFAGIFLLVFKAQITSSEECTDCTKCRKEYEVNGSWPDCPQACQSDKGDAEFMKMCGLSFRCTRSSNVEECYCTHKACSGGQTVKMSLYLLFSYMIVSVSIQYLI